MDSIKDYLSKLEIKNDFLYKKLSDVFVTKVVYYKENKTFYIYLSSRVRLFFRYKDKNKIQWSIS